MNKTKIRIATSLFVVFALVVWFNDLATFYGETTVYTVRCDDGQWNALTCTGKMVAADRYQYRVSTARRKAAFAVLESPESSGRLTDCDVSDARNWTCLPRGDAARSIVLEMAAARPAHDTSGSTRPFHAVRKWKWWLLRYGIANIQRADS
jgi:hypothetical protein